MGHDLALVPAFNDPDSLIETFLSGRSEKTRLAYNHDLNDLANWLSVEDANALARKLLTLSPGEANALVLRYRNQMLDRALSPATVNRRIAAIRSLLKLARTLGLIGWTLEIRNVKAQSYRDTTGPGRAGFHAMLEAAETRTDAKGIRDLAILRLLHDLALRRNEVASLDLADLDLSRSQLMVLGKGKTQKVPLTFPTPTLQALGAWIKARGTEPGSLLLNLDHAKKGDRRLTGTSIYRIIRDLGASVGIKTRPHGLRHTAITEAVKLAQSNGIGLDEVRDFSRHSDVKVLMIYRDRDRCVQGKLSKLISETPVRKEAPYEES